MMKEMKKFGIACSALLIIAVLVLSGCSSDGQQENDLGAGNSTAQNDGNIGTITSYELESPRFILFPFFLFYLGPIWNCGLFRIRPDKNSGRIGLDVLELG